jgi:hypothetical protein
MSTTLSPELERRLNDIAERFGTQLETKLAPMVGQLCAKEKVSQGFRAAWPAIKEYCANAPALKREGTTLSAYVETWLRDNGQIRGLNYGGGQSMADALDEFAPGLLAELQDLESRMSAV